MGSIVEQGLPILIVENNPFTQYATARLVGEVLGPEWKILTASNQEEALKAISGQSFNAGYLSPRSNEIEADTVRVDEWGAFILGDQMIHNGQASRNAGVEIARAVRDQFHRTVKVFFHRVDLSDDEAPTYRDAALFDGEIHNPLSINALRDIFRRHNLF